MPNPRSKRPQGHRQQKVVALRAVPTLEPPEPPENLCAFALTLWREIWTTDVSKAIEASDHYALRRWIEAVDERERYLEAARDNPTVEGSKGQPVVNPLLKLARAAEDRIEHFEQQFGMTPKARADLGLAAGNAALTAEELNRMARNNAADPDADETETIEGEAEEVEGFEEA